MSCSGPWLFELSVYAPEQDLPEPGKFEYTGSAWAQFFRVSCIRPGPGTCQSPENLSIQILPWARLFELSVYAPEQEPAWTRKI